MDILYNIDFDIAAIVISLIAVFYIFSKKSLQKSSNGIFLAIILTGLVSAVADVCSAIANSRPNGESFAIQNLFNYLYLFVHNLLPYLILLYVIYIFNLTHYLKKKHYILITLPLATVYFFLLINTLTQLVFYYDENGIYQHGLLFPLLYTSAALYMLSSMILVIRFRKSFSVQKSAALLFYMIISVIPVIIQAMHPYLLLEIFCQSIGLMGILLSIENKDDIINASTRVFNRYAFLNRVGGALNVDNTTLLVIKLSNIQYYNTTLGAESMSGLLREVARWLDHLDSRLSCYDCDNGHFALLGEDLTEEQSRELKKRIFDRFENPWGHGTFLTTFPVEICQIKTKTVIHTMENLLLILDLPFEELNSCEIDAAEVVSTYQRRILVERLINKALEKKSFQVWYQPIWDKCSGRIHSAEALVRLIDDEFGFISPEEFIPIAEQNGTVIEIGAFVFDEVCRFYQEHVLSLLGIDYVEVNLSVVQCMNQRLVEAFDKVLTRYHLSADRINLEITESAASGNKYTLTESVRALEARGFRFSLDDYGTGYSNISYMFDMPFKIIKLDKSILWSAMDPKTHTGDKNAMILLEHTIRMMKEMHYEILVEGVETVEQKMLLERLGCDYFQGYYFSKPVPGDTFLDFIKVVNA
ncbi:MAG: EAL domain-containing protein [Lachnospiraceae bacterium]|nr:EAL domain-containing protein [Lachnospiraceae bacterium]